MKEIINRWQQNKKCQYFNEKKELRNVNEKRNKTEIMVATSSTTLHSSQGQ